MQQWSGGAAGILLVFLLHFFAAPRLAAATVEWDGGGGDPSWHTAANWTGDRTPASGDDVVLNAPSGVTVVIASGLNSVRSLQCATPLQMTGGRLTLMSGRSLITGTFELTGSAQLRLQGAGTELSLEGETTLAGGSLEAAQGATLRLPAARTLDLRTRNLTLAADGAGSVCDAALVTQVLWGANVTLRLEATGGGRLLCPALSGLEGNANVVARGAGSRVDLTGLQGVWSNTNATRRSSLEILDGAEVRAPGLTGLTRVDLTLRQAGAGAPLAALASFRQGQMDVQTTTLEFPTLALLENAGLLARAGTRLTLPQVRTVTFTDGAWTWEVRGPNSQVDLPEVAALSVPAGTRLELAAEAGGALNLPRLSACEGSVSARVEGAGSRLDLPALAGVWSAPSATLPTPVEVVDGGELRAPGLTGLHRRTLTLRGGASRFPTDGLRSLTQGVLALESRTNEFPQLTDVQGSDLTVTKGAAARFAALTALTLTDRSQTFRADGVGSVLDLAQVERAEMDGNLQLELTAANGGRIRLPRLANPNGRVRVTARGAGAHIDLSGVTGRWQSPTHTWPSLLLVETGGAILIPGVTVLERFEVHIADTGVLSLDPIRALVRCSLTVDGATAHLPNLTDKATSTFIYWNGGQTIFPPAADLVVTEILPPAAAAAGELVTLIWTVHNRSATAVDGVRSDALYLSPNRTVGSDQFLGHFSADNTLGAGESRRYTNSVIVPLGRSGAFYFVVEADSQFECFEDAAEENNFLVASNATALASADLQVVSLTAPAQAQFGQTLPITWVVRNVGTSPATRSWNDRLYLAPNASNLTGARILLTRAAVATLAAGASYTNTQTLALPADRDAQPVTRHLLVATDSGRAQPEADELNNLRGQPIELQPPPRPDLAVAALIAPGEAVAGRPVSIVWCVTNRGAASASGPWIETLAVSNALAGTVDLARFDSTDPLAAGASAWRTQAVALPVSGLAGELRFVAQVDRFDDVLESDEANNLTQAGGATLVPLQLSLLLPAETVAEHATSPLRGVVTRNGSTLQPVGVTFTSSDPNELVAPPSLTLGVGQATATVEFAIVRDHRADGPKPVRLSATAPGYPPAEVTVTVLDVDLPQLALSFDTPEVEEGHTVSAVVSRERADPTPLVVTLASDHPGQLSPPLTVTVPAHTTQWRFAVLAVDDTIAEPPGLYPLTASAPGHEPSTAAVTIRDNDVPALQLTLADRTVSEGAGNQATQGTLTRDPVSARALTVEIASSDPAAAFAPARVVIPAHQARVSFPISARDDDLLDGPQTATLTPYVLASGTTVRLAEGSAATLTVLDDDGPSLRLEAMPTLIPEGGNPAATLRVVRNTPATNALTLTLTSSDSREVVVPATLTLPAGTNAVAFGVATPADGIPDGNRSVTLTASAPGYTPGTVTLVVTDSDLPDLVVTDVSAPATGLAGLPARFSYRIVNQGLVSTATNFVTRVFLSPDPTLGDDLLLHQQRFSGVLAVGQELTQTLALELPANVGTYWLAVITDADQQLTEGLEDNNTRVAVAPLAVQPEYTATAQARVDLVPPGTAIAITGVVQFAAAPRAHVPVEVHLSARGTRRTLRTTTLSDHRFFLNFQPLPTETGFFELSATAPGVPPGPPQDEFRILGLKPVPAAASFTLPETTTVERTVKLRNLSDVPLTGLAVEVISAPPGLQVQFDPLASPLAGAAAATLVCRFTAAHTDASGTVDLRVTCVEGVTAAVHFAVRVEPLYPRLVAAPTRLVTGMARGRHTPVQFALINEGGAASGPLTVVLPEAPWLHLASTNPLPALRPGQTQEVTLLLAPAPDLALGPYQGAFTLNATNASLTVPFEFRAVSEAQGDLRVLAEDEFTYYAAGAPRVAQAKVVVRDAYALGDTRTAVTDSQGVGVLPALTEGLYEVEVTADDHVGYRNTVMVAAGQTTELTAFLSRTTVRYHWTVEPVAIEDRYRIRVETTFETAVPVPVVTMEPRVIDLADYAGVEGPIEFRIANHGLIAANRLTLRVPLHSAVQFPTLPISEIEGDVAVLELGTLAAQTSLALPGKIRGPGAPAAATLSGRSGREEVAAAASAAPAGGGGGPCSYQVDATWQLTCGYVDLEYDTSTTVYNNGPGCGSALPSWDPGPAGTSKPARFRPPGGMDGRGGWVATTPPPYRVSSTCDPDCLVRAGIGCLPGPLGDALGIQQCISGLFGNEFNPLIQLDCTVTGLGMLPGGDTPACAYDVLRCFMEFTPLSLSAATDDGGGAAADPHLDLDPDATGPRRAAALLNRSGSAVASGDTLAPYRSAMQAFVAMVEELTGSAYRRWFQPEDVPGNPDAALRYFADMLRPESEAGRAISEAEWINFLGSPFTVGVEPIVLETFRYRWGYTLDAWARGVYGPHEANGNIIDYEKLLALALAYKSGHEWALQNGYPNPLIAILETIRTLAAQGENGGICARVKFRTEQEAVISRDAFRAALELENQDLVRLEDIQVTLQVLDASGQDVTSRFAFRSPELTGLSGVDGAGLLPAGVTGTARWIIIPTRDAAPTETVVYYVTGRFRYTLAGTEVSVPLAIAPITVLPSPRLLLHYFHERNVFSDDPFTPDVEPRIPFNLAVLVQNLGHGTARNFRIRSGQPQIVENLKGLLIDYQILATEVAGQPLAPTLTASFGDLGPGGTAIGRWLFGSSLHGLFTDYQASFEHLDALGDQKISLIDGLTIHEMIHLVHAAGAFEDGRPDFLVNDVPDLFDLPDTLYLSDGSSNAVAVVETAVPSAPLSATNLTVTLTAPLPSRWAYLRIPDPGAGRYRLARITRDDGVEIALGVNAWVTDRTFFGLGRRPAYEHILHLLDYDSPGQYTLTYVEPSNDTTPPASQVLPLAAQSGEGIAVAWAGEDEPRGTGIAAFDVYVSEDHGPFLLWLAQTTAYGAVYPGVQGRTYAFYSVATDFAGNVEAIPGAPDTRTVVSLVNRPPGLGPLADRTLDEGTELQWTIPATDPDLPADRVTFSLVEAPPGLTLDAQSGLTRWRTTEANGPGSYRVAFLVTDNGSPSLSVTGVVQVIVREVNAPPQLTVPTNQVMNEGRRLTLTLLARDFDQPANSLRFALGDGRPTGATLDPVSGVFSWQPTETQGPSTNRIPVIVTDDGIPPLSATNEFVVVVRDTLSELVVGLGAAHGFAGETVRVPLQVTSGLELETLRFELEIDGIRLTNLAVPESAAEIAYLLFEPVDVDRYGFELGFNPARLESGARRVAWLELFTAPEHGSAVVPLRVRAVTARRSGGGEIGNASGQDGRVIIVEREPVLEALRPSPSTLRLLLYGRPGTNYVLESTPGLVVPQWTPGARHTPTERIQTIDLPISDALPGRLYRFREQP